ncbi:hypothetical protein A8990_12059 [Paenibacillus taihuensis]|uniref:Uncharacterized protein n=1 Tax=Paenibacillus taihuensis TaxID=1156355 RepID=A0A3D9RM96_9BACL|nr:hypothetical protein A8990_12059 [Paenibacillus taihuensis]
MCSPKKNVFKHECPVIWMFPRKRVSYDEYIKLNPLTRLAQIGFCLEVDCAVREELERMTER